MGKSGGSGGGSNRAHCSGKPSGPAASSNRSSIVYYGTSKQNANAIMKLGFKPSSSGLLGKGVYVTTDKSKAEAFARPFGVDGRVIKARANFGNVKMVDARPAREGHFAETQWQKAYDTAFVPKGEGVKRPEHCVRDASRVTPIHPMGISKPSEAK